MKKLTLLIALVLTGCGTIQLSSMQKFDLAKGSVRAGASLYITRECKEGMFRGLACSEAQAQVGPIVDTLAADFQPGVKPEPEKRAITRAAVSREVAKALHPEAFASDDNMAKAAAIEEVRQLIDTIADAIAAAVGK